MRVTVSAKRAGQKGLVHWQLQKGKCAWGASVCHRGVRVLPLFFGLGKHARQDLPLLAEALQQAHPQVRFEWLPTPTEQPRLLALLAELAVAESPP